MYTLKKEVNEKVIAKADSQLIRALSFPRHKLSISQALTLDALETEMLLSEFAQQLYRKSADVPTFTLLHLTLPEHLHTWF